MVFGLFEKKSQEVNNKTVNDTVNEIKNSISNINKTINKTVNSTTSNIIQNISNSSTATSSSSNVISIGNVKAGDCGFKLSGINQSIKSKVNLDAVNQAILTNKFQEDLKQQVSSNVVDKTNVQGELKNILDNISSLQSQVKTSGLDLSVGVGGNSKNKISNDTLNKITNKLTNIVNNENETSNIIENIIQKNTNQSAENKCDIKSMQQNIIDIGNIDTSGCVDISNIKQSIISKAINKCMNVSNVGEDFSKSLKLDAFSKMKTDNSLKNNTDNTTSNKTDIVAVSDNKGIDINALADSVISGFTFMSLLPFILGFIIFCIILYAIYSMFSSDDIPVTNYGGMPSYNPYQTNMYSMNGMNGMNGMNYGGMPSYNPYQRMYGGYSGLMDFINNNEYLCYLIIFTILYYLFDMIVSNMKKDKMKETTIIYNK